MNAIPAIEREKLTSLPKVGTGTSILVVSSDQDHRLMMAMLLAEEGHQVLSCGENLEALSLFEKENFHFVIVEHQPPDFDGLYLLETMKQRTTRTPILVISSQYEMEPYLAAMNLGALDYLNRPIDYLDIQRLVKTYGQPPLTTAASDES